MRVWLAWLARLANNEVTGIKTAIGIIPTFEEVNAIFNELIPDKGYTTELYNKQFALYVDNIIARIDMQVEAYKKEANVPEIYFETQTTKRARLQALKSEKGSVVIPDQLAEMA